MRRSHVELRSYDITPPCQYVGENHAFKREIEPKPIREFNAMTLPLWQYKLRHLQQLGGQYHGR